MDEPRRGAAARPVPRFDRHFLESREPLTLIGSGGLGGKAAGLAFVRDILAERFRAGAFDRLSLGIPRATVLGTDLFEQFIEHNRLHDYAAADVRDEVIAHAFQRAELPPLIVGDLQAMVAEVRTPLAVRSSSHLEDAMYEPFASVYTTKMIPNNQHDPDTRFRRLVEAIKFVYASTWFREARNYISASSHGLADEKMAVIVQEVIGRRHSDRFYPDVSGVARSFNYYPSGNARAEEGVLELALGLGKTIVDEGVSWSISPAHPRVRPPFNSIGEMLDQAQGKFWAVNMGPPPAHDPIRETEYLVLHGLDAAEQDGTLAYIASTYRAEDDRLVPGASARGPRLLDFAPLLSGMVCPLPEAIRELLQVCETAVGAPVEIEFAMTLDPRHAVPAHFGFLQVRPMVVSRDVISVTTEDLLAPEVIIASHRALGNGSRQFEDVVFVKRANFDVARTTEIADQLEQVNRKLVTQRRPYLLIGFGRWGSSDPSGGIPVNFGQIAGASAIVEATLPGLSFPLSQGSHFFHNLTSFEVLYLSVPHQQQRGIDWERLENLDVVEETDLVRHARVSGPLSAHVDGRSGRGVIRE